MTADQADLAEDDPISTQEVPAGASSSVQAFLARTHKLLIGGHWVEARSGESFDTIDPATGQPLARVALGGAADIDLAVRAARAAFDRGVWSDLSFERRRAILLRLADLIEAEEEDLALLESLDVGMPVAGARFLAGPLNYENIRYLAGWVGKIGGQTYQTARWDEHAFSVREPIGVVGTITPWNAPLRSVVNKVVPALVAGCTVVAKPAEVAPLTAIRFGELCQEAGIPDGVVNIVTGYGHDAGKALAAHPDVDKISFTGSTETGKEIVRLSTGNLKRVTLELGGKSPVFIFPDADIDQAIAHAAMGIFSNSGQVCVAGSRLYAHRDIYDRVVEGVASYADGLKVGAGTESGVGMGPVVSQAQHDRVLNFLAASRREGASVITGGAAIERPGFFIQPTVLAETKPSMSVVQQEIFGPVLCAMPINDEDIEALARYGNDTAYGLAAYIWTRDLGLAHKLAKKLRAGWIRVNGGSAADHNVPFGGYKQSGWGRERGREGIEAYTETKSVIMTL